MARRPSVNDHLVARDPQARAVPHRWQSAVPPIDPTSAHAGPSRQTFDYHDRPDPGWNADEFRNPRPPIPPYGWTADERDDQNARDGLLSATAVGVESNAPTAVSVRPGYEPAPPLHPSSAHEVHARRVSAEEWQYRQPTIPPTGSLPSAMSGAVRLDPTALVAPTTSPWPPRIRLPPPKRIHRAQEWPAASAAFASCAVTARHRAGTANGAASIASTHLPRERQRHLPSPPRALKRAMVSLLPLHQAVKGRANGDISRN